MTLAHYRQVRARSLALAAPLSGEDCAAQSMPDASPVKWHLAHTTWFFETFVLERFEPEFTPFHAAFRMLFNSYYNGVGERHPRAARGLLTRPSLEEVLAYRQQVDARMARLLADDGCGAELAQLTMLGLQHEQQHQELMLTDVLHLLSCNPMLPAYHATPSTARARAPAPGGWIHFDGGLTEVGHDGAGFCFDNELPRHRHYLAPFALARSLVTNGEYLAFMQDGGYREPSLWLAEGWDFVNQQGIDHPLYWRRAGDQWRVFSLDGEQALDPARPVTHLSLYEAAAYAAWADARLPTEMEWEAGAAHPGMDELYGPCWQWTSSSYAPYPGFSAAPGALGEYNGKFMLNQYVLRGASHATADGHARRSYRNFFPAATRWQFTGLRLAR